MTAERSQPARTITIDALDLAHPTADELQLYCGLTVNAEQYVKDSGASVEDDIANLSTHDLLEFRYQLAEQWGDADKINARLMKREETELTVDGVVWHLLQMIEHEIGGRWVDFREPTGPH